MKDLRRDPDCIEITLAGEDFPFLITGYGIRAAQRDAGVDLIASLFRLIRTLMQKAAGENGEMPEDDEAISVEDLAGMDLSSDDVEALYAALYAGVVSFDEWEYEYDDLLKHVSLPALLRLLPEIGPKLFGVVQEAADGPGATPTQAENGDESSETDAETDEVVGKG